MDTFDDKISHSMRCKGMATVDLTYETSTHEGWSVLAVEGEIDVATAGQLREQVNAMIANGARSLVVDLNGVEFMDSTGLGVLVGAHKRLAELEGSMRVVCTQPTILKVFSLTGLDAVIPMSTDLASVLAAS